jgi:hypothetical protein
MIFSFAPLRMVHEFIYPMTFAINAVSVLHWQEGRALLVEPKSREVCPGFGAYDPNIM